MLIGERNSIQLKLSDIKTKVLLSKKSQLSGVRINAKNKKSDTVSLEISKIESDSISKENTQNIRIYFTAWDTGYVTLLPFEIDSLSHLSTQAMLLKVNYPKVNLQGDIQDIKTGKIDLDAIQKQAQKSKKSFWIYILGAIVLLSIALLLYFKLRKKKTEETPIVVLSIYEHTKQALDALMAKKRWEKDQTKLHFIALTEILKTYVAKQFCIDALEKTTNELSYALKSINIPAQQIDLLIRLLQASDLVKFAKQSLVQEEIISINQQAYFYLEMSNEKVERDKKENVLHE
jgi:hypothetical protein